MSVYRGTDEQRLALHAALVELHKRGIPDQAIVAAIHADKKRGLIAEFDAANATTVSRATVNRYRLASDARIPNGRRAQLALLYNFLAQSKLYPTALSENAGKLRSAHEMSPLLDALMIHMGPRKGQLDLEDLKSLEGTFHVYRRSWTSADPDDYIVSVLTFEWVGNALFFSDTQSYFDETSRLQIDETDRGVALPFGMNLVLLARGDNREVIKFSSVDDFYRFPDGIRLVDLFSGNAIAVSGKGPHPGYALAGERVKVDEARSAFLKKKDVPRTILAAMERAIKKPPQYG